MGFNLNPLHDVAEAAHDVKNDVVAPVVRDVAAPVVRDVAAPAVKVVAHDVAAPLLNALNMPLQTVQHVYRTEHDVWTRYGVSSFIGDNTYRLLGGALDKNLDPQVNAAWERTGSGGTGLSSLATNNPNYRDIHGNAVNPGFDVANIVDNLVNGHDYMPAGWKRNQQGVMEPTQGGGVDVFTGAINAAFDLGLDPTLKVGKVLKAIKSTGVVLRGARSGAYVVGLSDDVAERANQIKRLSDTGIPLKVTPDGKQAVVGGRVIVAPRAPTLLVKAGGHNASDIPMMLKNNGGFRDAAQRIAGMKSPEEIFTAYPSIGPTALASELAKAKTAEEVGSVFEDALTTENYKFGPNGLPSTGLVRRVAAQGGLELPTLGQVGSRVADSNALFRKASSYRPNTFDHRTLQMSDKVFDPDDPNFAKVFRSSLLAVGHNRRTANAITGAYLDTPDLGARTNMVSHMLTDAARTAGIPDDHDFVVKYGKLVDFMTKNSARFISGYDKEGNPLYLTDEESGAPTSRGLLGNQVGKIALPNFNEFNQAVRESKGGLGKAIVKGDDWLYEHYTRKFFKGLVLLSLGFPFRVAAGEITPAILANSAREYAGSLFEHAAMRANPTLKDLSDEYGPEALIGHRAEVKVPHPENPERTVDRVGRISAVDAENGKITVDHRDGTSFEHNMGDVTVVQKDIKDSHIMKMAHEMGIEVDKKELPHYRAAIAFALHGVGRALVDEDYINAATRTSIASGTHTIPSSAASNHDVASSMAGRIEDLKDQYKQAGARLPDKPSAFSSTEWRGYDAGMANHPVFWSHAIHEAAKDSGTRLGAEAYRDTYRDHISNPTHFEIQERGNRGQIVVATRSGNLRGSLQFEHEGNALKVGFSSVADEAQGEGVHSAMREALYKHAAERGLDVIHPEVVNEHLLSSYAKDKRLVRTSENSFRKPVNLEDVKDPAAIAAEGAADRAFLRADLNWMHADQSDEAVKFRQDMAYYSKNAPGMARNRLELVKGLAYGQNGKLNDDVMASIAGKRAVPSIGSLASRHPDFRPLRVKGRVVEEGMPPKGLDRFTQRGWRVMHPIINGLSRQPLYTMFTAQEYKGLKQAVDLGTLDVATAHRLAQVRAMNRMIPFIHNPRMRSQFADLTRNFMPFFYAQEQAYKRYGRAILSNPMAFRKAALAEHAISNSGVMRADAQGNQSIVLPGGTLYGRWITAAASGFGVNTLAGLPSTISGDTISLKSVYPEGNLPSVSPLVAIGLEQVQHYFPASEPLLSHAIGPVNASQSVTDQLIPNATLKRVLQATTFSDRSTAFATAFMQNMASAQYRSDVLTAKAQREAAAGDTAAAKRDLDRAAHWFPPSDADPGVKQAAIDRLRSTTRIQMLMKAAVGLVSPLSPTMDNGDLTLQNDVRQELASKGVKGLDDFISKHPNATAYTVFQSDNSATGTSLPATKAAYDWVTANRKWIGSHNLAAAYLIPQTTQAYDVEAYNQELAMGLRNKRTPGTGSADPNSYIAALYTAATDAKYYPSLDVYEKERTALADNSAALSDLDSQWAAYKAQLATANPVWAANQPSKNPQVLQTAQLAFQQLSQAVSDPRSPQSPQTALVKTLVDSYNSYLGTREAIRAGVQGGTLTDLKDQFNVFLDGYAQANPNASAVVTGVFRRMVDASG